jgi:hypothetical protein
MEDLNKVIAHFNKQIRIDLREDGKPNPWSGREFGDYTIKGIDISTGVLRVNLDSGICSMWYDWDSKYTLLDAVS